MYGPFSSFDHEEKRQKKEENDEKKKKKKRRMSKGKWMKKKSQNIVRQSTGITMQIGLLDMSSSRAAEAFHGSPLFQAQRGGV